jgi:hypothetical protein
VSPPVLKLERQKAKSVTNNDGAFITIPILRLTQQVRLPTVSDTFHSS